MSAAQEAVDVGQDDSASVMKKAVAARPDVLAIKTNELERSVP